MSAIFFAAWIWPVQQQGSGKQRSALQDRDVTQRTYTLMTLHVSPGPHFGNETK